MLKLNLLYISVTAIVYLRYYLLLLVIIIN